MFSPSQEQLLDKLHFTSPRLAKQIRRIDAVDGQQLTLRTRAVSQIVNDDALDRARHRIPRYLEIHRIPPEKRLGIVEYERERHWEFHQELSSKTGNLVLRWCAGHL